MHYISLGKTQPATPVTWDLLLHLKDNWWMLVVSGQAMLPLKLDHWFSDKLPFHGLLHSLTISSKRCHALALLSTFIVPSLWPERVLCQWRLSPWFIYSGMIWLELCNTLHYLAACHALSDFLIISNLGTCDLITWGRATLLRLHAVCNPAGWTSPGSTVKCGAGNGYFFFPNGAMHPNN